MEVDPQEGLQPLPLHLGGRAPQVIPRTRMVVGWDESMQKGLGRFWVLKTFVFFKYLQLHWLPELEAHANDRVLCSVGCISWGPWVIAVMRATRHDTSGPPKGDTEGKLPLQYRKISAISRKESMHLFVGLLWECLWVPAQVPPQLDSRWLFVWDHWNRWVSLCFSCFLQI